MSIPERLWWIAKSRWPRPGGGGGDPDAAMEIDIEARQAEAAAYEELAEALRHSRPAPVYGPTVTDEPRVLPNIPTEPAGGGVDPLAASYALLQVDPGCTLQQVENAYRARVSELRTEQFPEGSPQRSAEESRRHALDAAYQKLRDVLNPTETRFEHIEF
jgi:hypothetical protein